MGRGDYKLGDAPYAYWDVQVEEQNRIRLWLPEVREVVPWLDAEAGSIDCIAFPAAKGGVQIEPFASEGAARKRFAEQVRSELPRSSETAEKWIDVARVLATQWRVAIGIDKNRINIPIPEPVRKGLLLPSAPARVVVFGFGDILEVWDANNWYEHVRLLSGTRGSSLLEAIEHLENR